MLQAQAFILLARLKEASFYFQPNTHNQTYVLNANDCPDYSVISKVASNVSLFLENIDDRHSLSLTGNQGGGSTVLRHSNSR